MLRPVISARTPFSRKTGAKLIAQKALGDKQKKEKIIRFIQT
jgi:hypothetical protein